MQLNTKITTRVYGVSTPKAKAAKEKAARDYQPILDQVIENREKAPEMADKIIAATELYFGIETAEYWGMARLIDPKGAIQTIVKTGKFRRWIKED